jgi:hypothetical protein
MLISETYFVNENACPAIRNEDQFDGMARGKRRRNITGQYRKIQ